MRRSTARALGAVVLGASLLAVVPVAGAGGERGTEIVSVVAKPGTVRLRDGVETRLDANAGLRLEVWLRNTGDEWLRNVQVRLTVQARGERRRLSERRRFLAPGRVRRVVFEGLADVVVLAAPVLLKVAVLPAEYESFLDDNAASYPVVVAFGG